jgi:ubiquinone/menaquinone biosynthesis C-methylase UbiE
MKSNELKVRLRRRKCFARPAWLHLYKIRSDKGDVSILDVGCGRGEWLELLQENGYRAKGIDINGVALLQCRERGLDVTESDVIEYLKGL